MKKLDLKGHRYGRLLVIDDAPKQGRRTMWLAVCDCGCAKIADADNLRSGKTTSCGCVRAETTSKRSKKHGNAAGKRTREYRAWLGAKSRCYLPTSPKYPIYGARGICMCDEWVNDFSRFLSDMGTCPEGHTMDRIDPDGDYCPTNCRWATPLVQANNRRCTIRLESGETLADFARRTGQDYKLLHKRMREGIAIGEPIALIVNGSLHA